jgi:stage III sporulation protein AA
VDEITQYQDIRAMTMAAGCGVGLLATIHASDVEELLQKPLYRELLE